MENASKALLIAGGILLLMILVSLILYVKGTVAEYYASEQQLEDIADTAKFNEQFTNYNRKDVQGYELISLVNKVVDYNERLSTETTNGNDVQAKPITVKITLWGGEEGLPKTDKKVENLKYGENWYLFKDTGNSSFAKNGTLTQSNSKSELDEIIKEVQEIEGRNKYISALTKKITSIIVNLNDEKLSKTNPAFTEDYLTSQQKADKENIVKALTSFYTITGNKAYEVTINSSDKAGAIYNKYMDAYKKMKDDNFEDMYVYYEYTQFRKAYFECKKLDYDSTTGKVNSLEFTFTGKIE